MNHTHTHYIPYLTIAITKQGFFHYHFLNEPHSVFVCLAFMFPPVTLLLCNPSLCKFLLFNKSLFFSYRIIISFFCFYSFFFSLSATCLLDSCMSSVSFPSLRYLQHQLTVILCASVYQQALLVYENKVRHVPEGVKQALRPSVKIISWTELKPTSVEGIVALSTHRGRLYQHNYVFSFLSFRQLFFLCLILFHICSVSFLSALTHMA